MDANENNSRLDDFSRTAREYVNLRLDEYRLKGVENFSIISNKALVMLVATMLGAVILQLLGFAFAFFIGDLLGSTALGFVIMALLFLCALCFIYAKRETLFIGKMIRMYMKMFFGDNSFEDLKEAQVETRHKIAIKEMELQAHTNAMRELLNPMTYINRALSKISYLEQFMAAFMRGYAAVRDFIRRYKDKDTPEPPAQTEEADVIPDNK